MYALAGAPAVGSYAGVVPVRAPGQPVRRRQRQQRHLHADRTSAPPGAGYDGPTGLGTPNGVAAFSGARARHWPRRTTTGRPGRTVKRLRSQAGAGKRRGRRAYRRRRGAPAADRHRQRRLRDRQPVRLVRVRRGDRRDQGPAAQRQVRRAGRRSRRPAARATPRSGRASPPPRTTAGCPSGTTSNCPDRERYDWTTASLKDDTTGDAPVPCSRRPARSTRPGSRRERPGRRRPRVHADAPEPRRRLLRRPDVGQVRRRGAVTQACRDESLERLVEGVLRPVDRESRPVTAPRRARRGRRRGWPRRARS